MPSTLTYPGVYIEEIPSGVRTITGVATSITAFVGRALKGRVNEPVTINSYGDYERIFGGLWLESSMSFAVKDFYLNGGSQAIIVRLFHPTYADATQRSDALDAANDVANASVGADAAAAAAAARTEADLPVNDPAWRHAAADAVATAAETEAARTTLPAPDAASVQAAALAAVPLAVPLTKASIVHDSLTLEAANEGAWGNKLVIRVDHDVNPSDPDKANLFNLTVKDGSGVVEVFRNVSINAASPRLVKNVLEQGSSLVRVTGSVATVPTAHPAPPAGKDPFDITNSPATCAGVASGAMASDGAGLDINDFTGSGKESGKQGLYALEKADLFNILCIPPYLATGNVDAGLIGTAASYCELKRRAMLVVDPPAEWDTVAEVVSGVSTVGTTSKNAALFFPRLRQTNPLRDNQLEDFVPCGAIAGIMARTDSTRGVWKAPAGLDATLVGVPALSVSLTDPENGQLNPLGVNCLRAMPAAGRVVWGARTLQGDDRLASEWKYVPVRRLALFLEESLYRGTQWVVFEPNDEPLWAQIRLNVGAFMHSLFRQGAFQGTTPKDAYFVKCDKETTTQDDRNRGVVNILVGFAPLKPAEFVVIKLQQMAGQIET